MVPQVNIFLCFILPIFPFIECEKKNNTQNNTDTISFIRCSTKAYYSHRNWFMQQSKHNKLWRLLFVSGRFVSAIVFTKIFITETQTHTHTKKCHPMMHNLPLIIRTAIGFFLSLNAHWFALQIIYLDLNSCTKTFIATTTKKLFFLFFRTLLYNCFIWLTHLSFEGLLFFMQRC